MEAKLRQFLAARERSGCATEQRQGNLEDTVVLGRDNVVRLGELLPFHEWPEPLDRPA